MSEAERFRRPGPWTAVPSHIARDRNYMNCSLPARHMHVMAWLYANRERTDGRLGLADFRTVAAEAQLSEHEAEQAAAELVAAELWRPGYELVDFLKWNLSAIEIGRRATENREAVRAFRAGKRFPPDPLPETETQNTQNTQVHNQLRNPLQGETNEQRELRLSIARLAKDKALELNGQGRQAMAATS